MPKPVFIGNTEKDTIHAELVANKQIIRDNLRLASNGGNWPDLGTLPQVGQDALEIVRENQIIFANTLLYLYKRMNEIDEKVGQR